MGSADAEGQQRRFGAFVLDEAGKEDGIVQLRIVGHDAAICFACIVDVTDPVSLCLREIGFLQFRCVVIGLCSCCSIA